MKQQRVLVSGPFISLVKLCDRMSANERLRSGRYGDTVCRSDVVYVDLRAVEDAEGITLSDEQIAAAVDGKPDRILVIAEKEVS